MASAFDEKDTTANVSVVSVDKVTEIAFRRVEGQAHPVMVVTFVKTVDGVPVAYSKRLTDAQAAAGWANAITRTIKNHLLVLVDTARAN